MRKRFIRLALLALVLGTLGGCAENLTALYHPACFTSYSMNLKCAIVIEISSASLE